MPRTRFAPCRATRLSTARDRAMRAAIAVWLLLALAACAEKPVTVAVDTLCQTPRYHTTDEQRAAAKADPATWFSLFGWLAAFDDRWDKRCR